MKKFYVISFIVFLFLMSDSVLADDNRSITLTKMAGGYRLEADIDDISCTQIAFAALYDNAGNMIFADYAPIKTGGKVSMNLGLPKALKGYYVLKLYSDGEMLSKDIYLSDCYDSSDFVKGSAVLKLPNAPLYIQNRTDAVIDVLTYYENPNVALTLTYTMGDSPSVSVPLTITETGMSVISVPLHISRNGIYTINAELKDDDGTVISTLSRNLTVYDYYTPQFLDEYSYIGINLRTPSDYASVDEKRKTVEYDVKLLNSLGIKCARFNAGGTWENVEPTFGYPDYKSTTDIWYELCKNAGIMLIRGIGGTYRPERTPVNKAILDHYGTYYNNTLLRYKDNITFIEVWNEPELDDKLVSHEAEHTVESDRYVYEPGYNKNLAILYSNIAKHASNHTRMNSPEMDIITGCVSSIGQEFLSNMYKRGLYKYSDGFSYHPYNRNKNPDTSFEEKMDGYLKVIREIGGWQRIYATEFGWRIRPEGDVEDEGLYVSNATVAAKYNTKGYIMLADRGAEVAAMYALYDHTGTLGLIKNNYEPKESLLAIPAMTRMLGNAVYAGQLSETKTDTGIKAYVFEKLGDTVVVAWNTSSSPKTITLQSTAVVNSVVDIYGNPFSYDEVNKRITLYDDSPIYIYIKGQDFICEAARHFVNEYINKFMGDVDLSSWSFTTRSLPSSVNADIDLNQVYAIGDELIAAYTPSQDLKSLALKLYDLHVLAEKAAVVAACRVGSNDQYTENSYYDETYNEITEEYKSNDVLNQKVFTEKILKYAKKHDRIAKNIGSKIDSAPAEIKNYLKSRASANNIMAQRLSNWARALAEIEPVDDTAGIIIYTSKPNISANMQGARVTFNLSVENMAARDVSGTIVIESESGIYNIVDDNEISVPSGEYREKAITFEVPLDALLGVTTLSVRFVDQRGVTLDETLLQGKITPIAEDADEVNQIISVSPSESSTNVRILTNMDGKKTLVLGIYDESNTLIQAFVQEVDLVAGSNEISIETNGVSGTVKVFLFDNLNNIQPKAIARKAK